MIALLFAAAAATANSAAASPAALTTVAERSGFHRTGRYEEVESLCAAFPAAYPGRVRCERYGVTPEGRPMLALIASADGALDPAAARERGRAVVFLQAGIHAGEIDGKDAGFLFLRELLDGAPGAGEARGALGKVTIVFVPVFNIDGHERFGRWNRPNQTGPEEMGWRTTAQNLNLNRDYMKVEAPEMQAQLGLLNAWDPILFLDLHVTDGSEFQPDVALALDPTAGDLSPLKPLGLALRKVLVEKLTAQGHSPLTFYPSFLRQDDPSSGFAVNVGPPRFSTPYWAARNRLALLVETHSWKDYPLRVRVTHDTIVASVAAAARQGAAWRKAAQEADARPMGNTPYALAYKPAEASHPIDFPGYAYVREPSAISGMVRVRYDVQKPQIWRVPLRDQVEPAVTVKPPGFGYLVPAAHAGWVAKKLEVHGISFTRIPEARRQLPVQTFRADKAEFAPQSFEGRQSAKVHGRWAKEPRDVPAGSLLVPLNQPAARLVLHLFEPEGPDSLVAWGFFNNAFERKEYMEAYVAEDVAREQLAKDPKLEAEFVRKLDEDPDFARSAEKRLEFFYKRSASWDDQLGLYPVYRLEERP